MNKPLLIGITGGTGSGKTTIADHLMHALPPGDAVILEHDAYYKDLSHLPRHARTDINYDHPDSFDNTLFVRQLDQLQAGEPVQVPIYDYVTHTRKTETRLIQPAPVIIVEGILVFVDPNVRARLAMKVFVDTAADIRMWRRIQRDMEHRCRTLDQIRTQYFNSVRPMHMQYIEPSKQWADVIIPGGGNIDVALHILVSALRQRTPIAAHHEPAR